MTFFQNLYLFWYYGQSTKIKLVTLDSIGVDEGYYECKQEEHAYIMQWYEDLKVLPFEDAKRLLDERGRKVEQKYFGPKWVRA